MTSLRGLAARERTAARARECFGLHVDFGGGCMGGCRRVYIEFKRLHTDHVSHTERVTETVERSEERLNGATLVLSF